MLVLQIGVLPLPFARSPRRLIVFASDRGEKASGLREGISGRQDTAADLWIGGEHQRSPRLSRYSPLSRMPSYFSFCRAYSSMLMPLRRAASTSEGVSVTLPGDWCRLPDALGIERETGALTRLDGFGSVTVAAAQKTLALVSGKFESVDVVSITMPGREPWLPTLRMSAFGGKADMACGSPFFCGLLLARTSRGGDWQQQT
jgi:hypothetical protein